MNSKQDKTQNTIEYGVNLIKNGQFESAKNFFVDLLDKCEDLYLAHYYLGFLAEKKNDTHEAVKQYVLSIKSNSIFVNPRESLALIYIKEKKWTEALDHINILITINKNNFRFYEYGAYIYRELKNPELAKDYLSKALALAPDNIDLATALAGFVDGEWQNPWPEINPELSDSFKLSDIYHKFWNSVDTAAPAALLARSLGRLSQPASPTDDFRPNLPKNPSKQVFNLPSTSSGNLNGLSVLFGPTVIAGVAPRLAKYLSKLGAKTTTIEYTPNYLSYNIDFVNKSTNLNDLLKFSDEMLRKAEKSDVICLDFCCSFKYLPNLGLDLRNEKTKNILYPDLFFLKGHKKKIISLFWGSDIISQSHYGYSFLKFLGINNIPEPPIQTNAQYRNVIALEVVTDCFLAPVYLLTAVPKVIPNWDISLDQNDWPEKKEYNNFITKILTAPTNKRKKNYDIIQSALNYITKKYPSVFEYTVQGKSHKEVPKLYSNADIGIEQATGYFGLLAIEMMALGLPVLGSFYHPSFGSFRELAPIIKYNNVSELSNKLEELICNPGDLKNIGKTGREYALMYHTSEFQGNILSDCINKLMAGEKLEHINSPVYKIDSQIWNLDPHIVEKFKYYDFSVPFFCSLAKYDYATISCTEAIQNNYKKDKFIAYQLAIIKFTESLRIYEQKLNQYLQNTKNIDILQLNHFYSILGSSKKLLEESSSWI
jgi:tetratricopeptide (TPR) repeat protein